MPQVDAALLEEIVNMTIDAVNNGKQQIFAISEAAISEYEAIQLELEDVRRQVMQEISLVDQLEREERAARIKLAHVSKNFHTYSQDDIRAAYDAARDLQVKLLLARNRESELRKRRDELERRLKALKEIVDRAETVASQISIALDYLTGRLKQLSIDMRGVIERSELAVAIMQAQEEERRRVAREIHDGPSQMVANAVMRLEICQRMLAEGGAEVQKELAELKKLLRQSLSDLRQIIFNLRPSALDDLGVIPAIKAYLNTFSPEQAARVSLTIIGEEKRLPPPVEVALFRMVQEAVTNSFRHSNGGSVSIKVEMLAKGVTVEVADDGCGFKVEEVVKSQSEGRPRGFGLLNMKERIELLGGKLQITSEPGKGTRLRAVISM